MIRHIHQYAAAPGRQEDAERALSAWIAGMQTAKGFRGAGVVREDGHMPGVLAVVQDWDTAEAAHAFLDSDPAANPTRTDIPSPIPPDQGGVLFTEGGHEHPHGGGHGHPHGSGHEHPHGSGHGHGDDGGHGHGHDLADALANLDFNRGGGLLARLSHGHFEVIAQSQPLGEADSPG